MCQYPGIKPHVKLGPVKTNRIFCLVFAFPHFPLKGIPPSFLHPQRSPFYLAKAILLLPSLYPYLTLDTCDTWHTVFGIIDTRNIYMRNTRKACHYQHSYRDLYRGSQYRVLHGKCQVCQVLHV